MTTTPHDNPQPIINNSTVDLSVEGAQDDAKLNLGACLLRNALRPWALRHAARHMSGAPIPGIDDGAWPGLPAFDEAAARAPAVISQDARGATWRRPFTDFDGDEPPGEFVPAWVAGAVLQGAFPYARELKAAFVLQPAEGSGLPSLLQSRLNAPRVLQAKKVAAYAAAKLAELGHRLAPVDVSWRDPASRVPPELRNGGGGGGGGAGAAAAAQAQQRRQQQDGLQNGSLGQDRQQQHSQQQTQQQQSTGQQQQSEQQQQQDQQQGQEGYLELTCNGMAVPADLSVAAIKKFLWRRGDDVLFHYRALDPLNPAPMPVIEMPAADG